MLFGDGVTATFQMTGFNNKQTRHIRIMGTEGEIWGCMADKKVYWQRYGKEVNEIDLTTLATNFSGHGGGDQGLVHDVIRYMRGEEFDTSSITFIDRSVESHYLAFAAEDSRVRGGHPVDVEAFKKNIKA